MIQPNERMRTRSNGRLGSAIWIALVGIACTACAGDPGIPGGAALRDTAKVGPATIPTAAPAPTPVIGSQVPAASMPKRRGSVSERGLDRPPTVILISLDGTRPADVTREAMPALFEFGERGLRAEGLIPVNPTNTFPNHVSLATGVRPEDHRLVNNSFIDPERGRFSRGEPNEWIDSEPIWSVAERHGVRTASYYWVGSEGPWGGGPGPSEFRKFSGRTREKTKVNRILKWLDEPKREERPRLITSWFHGADHAAHVSGPGTPEVVEALRPQDRQIERLIKGIESRGLFETTTLIFVSDHGMTKAARRVDLASELSRGGLRPSVLGIGGFSSIRFADSIRTPGRIDKAISIARALGLAAWRRAEAPANWHVGDARFGDVVVRAPMGTAIVRRSTRLEGFHGYDAGEQEMHGILLARGRGVVAKARLDRVSNLAVAPTVLALLGLPIPEQMTEPPIVPLSSNLETEAGVRPGNAVKARKDER